jgi:hypothetical protein
MFNRWHQGHLKNLGRVTIGLGLMLLALHLPVATMAPIENNTQLRPIVEALGRAPASAFGGSGRHLVVPLECRGRAVDRLAGQVGRHTGDTGARAGAWC